jgi:hypothetical protein
MTDRELLELAAKAAGKEVLCVFFNGTDTLVHVRATGVMGKICWSPLTDDGDARRLAEKMNISIEIDDKTETVGALWVDSRGNPGRLKDILCICYRDGDKAVSTRRAIVRAAAEIGRSMP